MREVILAETAGFCFGVQKAMDTVYSEVDKCILWDQLFIMKKWSKI